MKTPLRLPLALLLAATGPLLPGGAGAEPGRAPEMEEAAIRRVTQDWRNRVFVVLADGGPVRASLDEVEENPRTLFRKRRVGCAVFLGSGRFLLTTASVTAGGTEVEIFDGEGHHTLARVVGADPFLDLALLEAVEHLPQTEGLEPLSFGVEPPVGVPCLVLGSAYGHALSASLGKIAGSIEIAPGGVPVRAHRVVTDIYPGDSGAPVLDAEGRFLGLITGVSAPGRHPVLEETGEILGTNAEAPAGGVGFAVPGRECRRAWMDLRDFGRVRRGYLGVRVAATHDASGARVLNVRPDGPAAAAGLQPGDIVTQFGDVFVRGAHHFCAYVASEEPFRRLPMRVVRNGRERTLEVVVGVASELPRMQRMTLEDLGRPLNSPLAGPEGTPVTQDAGR